MQENVICFDPVKTAQLVGLEIGMSGVQQLVVSEWDPKWVCFTL